MAAQYMIHTIYLSFILCRYHFGIYPKIKLHMLLLMQ